VVALEWTYAEDLLALDLQPVGVADVEGYERWVTAGPGLGPEVTDVGTRQEPSLETIADLDPDLILGVAFRHEPIYDQLSRIAPTLLFDPYPGEDGPDQYTEMVQTFTTISEAVDRVDRAEEVLTSTEARLEQAREELAQAGVEEQPVVLAQAFTQEGAATVRLFTDNAMAIQILDRLGLENAWPAGFETYGFSTVGLEALEQVENATFLYVAQPEDDPVNTTWSQDPVWRNLTFVQEDRVHPLGAGTWLFGGPLSAQHVAEAVLQALTPGGR
jgi:iron complex transport system substrate-binding protein